MIGSSSVNPLQVDRVLGLPSPAAADADACAADMRCIWFSVDDLALDMFKTVIVNRARSGKSTIDKMKDNIWISSRMAEVVGLQYTRYFRSCYLL